MGFFPIRNHKLINKVEKKIRNTGRKDRKILFTATFMILMITKHKNLHYIYLHFLYMLNAQNPIPIFILD